jgi:hypothetical protein
LTASVTLEVSVKAGAAVPFKTHATPENAQLLRTVVWSLDIGDTVPRAGEAAPAVPIDEDSAASQDLDRPPPSVL